MPVSGPGGTLLARAERARRVAEARARREQWDVIAERERVSRSTAKRLAAEFEESGHALLVLDGNRVNPTAAVHRAIRAHLLALDEAEAAMATATNESAKVGAIKAATTTSASLLALLRGLGLLGNLHLAAFQREIGFAAEVIGALADAHGISDQELQEAVERVRRGPLTFDSAELPELVALAR